MDGLPSRQKRAAAGSAVTTRARGYTRMVSWRQRVSAIVIVVLAMLPAASNACATFCESTATAASTHHGSGANCEQAAVSDDAPQLSAPPHDCTTHQVSLRQVGTAAKARADLASSPVLPAPIATTTFAVSLNTHPGAVYGSPPGTTPPTTAPLVLRV